MGWVLMPAYTQLVHRLHSSNWRDDIVRLRFNLSALSSDGL